jgi:hypothetical protein
MFALAARLAFEPFSNSLRFRAKGRVHPHTMQQCALCERGHQLGSARASVS